MKDTKLQLMTPFIFGKLALKANFTDRETESSLLKRNLTSAISTILISPRRWGKTSLVQKCLTDLRAEEKGFKSCHLDLFSIRSEEEFYIHLANEVLKATSTKWEELTKNAVEFLSRFVPKITYTPEMQSELSFGVSMEDIKRQPDEILDLAQNIAAKKKIKIAVCIDEFQNIANYENPLEFQKKLRSHWQNHDLVSYCLYGSKRHMLTDIFSNPAMPFYKFGDMILLQKIKIKDWIPFIQKRFSETDKEISEELAKLLVNLVAANPYYVQQLAQQTWFRATPTATEQDVRDAHESISNQLSLLFTQLVESLSNSELNLLKAIINDEKQLTSKSVLETYRLNSSANSVRLKKKLIDNEIIDEENGEVVFLDPYFEYWLRTDVFK